MAIVLCMAMGAFCVAAEVWRRRRPSAARTNGRRG